MQRTSELCAAALLLLLVGCGQAAGPTETARQWLTHLEEGRLQEAYALLSPAAQSQLEDLAGKQLVVAPQTLQVAGDETPGAALFRSRAAPTHLGGVAPLPDQAGQLVLAMEETDDPSVAWVTTRDPAAPLSGPGSESTLRLRLVKTGEGWKVDLLTPRPKR